MGELLGALDQGTTSTRFIVFQADGREVARHQEEHRQEMPRPGWLEHDPEEIWRRSCDVIEAAMRKASLSADDLAAIGIANQRETTVLWDRRSGEPLHNAVVWQDTRTADRVAVLEQQGFGELIRERTGLVPSPYFSATKIAWLLEHTGALQAAQRGDVCCGTVDSWLVWKLAGGLHSTDVTNASRTMLMDLSTLDWDDELLAMLEIPRSMMPPIRPSTATSELFTLPDGPLGGRVPIAAVLGDQQAAMFGQACFDPGDAKCTYGTGSFILMNTGAERVRSTGGLLTTVCFQPDDGAATYALEGSVAASGSVVQWLRDELGIIESATDSEALAREVPDVEGLYFVPAFAGLFAPYWRADARGVIVGLTRAHTRAHLARAALEGIAYQTRDVINVMTRDSNMPIPALRVDGGVTLNSLAMQIQADVLDRPVIRPQNIETTAVGVAWAAGLAIGLYRDLDELRDLWSEAERWTPEWPDARRARGAQDWARAVSRSLGWHQSDEQVL